MLQKKILYFKRLPFLNFFPKFKKDLFFYPKNIIRVSKGYLFKEKGDIYLFIYKFSFGFFNGNFKLFPGILNLGSVKMSQFLLNKITQFNIMENTVENRGELKEILSAISKNYIFRGIGSSKEKRPSVLVIFPNQNCMVKLLKRILCNFNTDFLGYTNKLAFNLPYLVTSKKIKYGKILMPADNRDFFRDGNVDQFNIYGIIENSKFKISQAFFNSNICFSTPLALKRNKVDISKLLKNVDLLWIDSLETILMQNTENFFSLIKHFIRTRLSFLYNVNGILNNWKKEKYVFKIYITSFLLPNFILKLFSNLSLSNNFFSKSSKNLITKGIIVSSNKCFLKKNPALRGNLQLFKFLKSKIHDSLFENKKFNLLIFAKNYSHLIPLRNNLHRYKKKINLKINILTEYIKNEQIKNLKLSMDSNSNVVTLVTERFFFYLRYLFLKFDLIYFQTYPDNKEFYYEIVKQANS